MQLPADAHDTAIATSLNDEPFTPLAKLTGVASPQMPPVEETVNASKSEEELRNRPTAVQLPADAHDIE